MSFVRTRSPIGLDVGSRTVKAVQLSRAGGQWQISAAAAFPRALPDAQISAMEVRRMIDVLYRHNFHGRDIVLATPPLRLLDGTLELPKSGPDTSGLDQIARMEFARLQKCEPGAMEMGYWQLPAGPRAHQATRVMAMGCLHRDVEPLIDLYESEGLRVTGLDVEACALLRASTTRLADHKSLTGLFDLGWSCSRLAVVHQDTIVFSRVLGDSGMCSLLTSIQKHLGIDAAMADHVLGKMGLNAPADEESDPIADARRTLTAHFDTMVQELKISFSYATQQYPDAALQRLVIAGGGAGIAGVIQHLSSLIGTEVVTIAPKDLLKAPPALLARIDTPALTLATGLAQFCDE
ncbi:MAG TPA: pilus assembly protein PilM [Tepidisphaeraceae bacterium]|jgi:type IV pilus assembly protein PilM|nr:pilus assembly protein PilM [Tepidisphaeraceae bacterium]